VEPHPLLFCNHPFLQLAELGITHVLNCSSEAQVSSASHTRPRLRSLPTSNTSTQPSYGCTLHLPLRDAPDERIIEKFDTAFGFIEDCRARGGRCLLHCQRGISRRQRCPPVLTKFFCVFIQKLCRFQSLHSYSLSPLVWPRIWRHTGSDASARVRPEVGLLISVS
jgi:hypothetical protein